MSNIKEKPMVPGKKRETVKRSSSFALCINVVATMKKIARIRYSNERPNDIQGVLDHIC